MDRAPQPEGGDESSLLRGWLDFYRGAIRAKCSQLSPEQLIDRPAPPSALSLLGLVRHLSEMERAYVHFALRGDPLDLRYCGAANPEGDMEGLKADDVAPSIAAWEEDCHESDALLDAVALDAVAPGTGWSVRRTVMKLLGEYARHAGHADILRERIDGSVGE